MHRAKRIIVLILFVLALSLVSTASSLAQSTPFLSHDEIRMLINEISGDRAYEHVRWLSHWARERGSEGYFDAVDYILQAAKDAGLEEVRFIEQPFGRGLTAYNARSAELWMVEPVEVKLADIGDHVLYLATYSYDADVTAELVWIGDASEESLEGLDVTGKLVLTDAQPSEAVKNAVWGKGAAGVVSYPINNGKARLDFPDQIAWSRIPRPEGSQPGAFAFVLSSRGGETLRHILETEEEQDFFRTGKRTPGGRVVLKAKVDTEFSEGPARTGFVEGWIRGTKYHDQQIVLTSHIQEEATSANDNASGMASILELARLFNKLIDEGKMERPLRDIRFWWADEIESEYRYFRDYPEEASKMLANINQDDELIHSNDDDLFNIDPTQLARNGFIVGALTYVLAFTEAEDVLPLTTETFLHGERRLANDLAVAARRAVEGEDGWKDATLLVEEAVARETRALESIRVFAGSNSRANQAIDFFRDRLPEKQKQMSEILAQVYVVAYGRKPIAVQLSAEEEAASKKIPANIADVDAYFIRRDEIEFEGKLERLMQDETYNFVDGKRSYYDIYKAVRAEALAHGEWYYGQVTLAEVAALLDAAVEAEALVLEQSPEGG